MSERLEKTFCVENFLCDSSIVAKSLKKQWQSIENSGKFNTS
jgi:hypothetical protein